MAVFDTFGDNHVIIKWDDAWQNHHNIGEMFTTLNDGIYFGWLEDDCVEHGDECTYGCILIENGVFKKEFCAKEIRDKDTDKFYRIREIL